MRSADTVSRTSLLPAADETAPICLNQGSHQLTHLGIRSRNLTWERRSAWYPGNSGSALRFCFASFSSRGSPCRGLWGHSRSSPQAAPGRGGASCRSFTHVAWRLGQARPARWAGHLAARTNGLRSARPYFPAAPGWDRAAESVQTPQGTEGGGAGLPDNAWRVLPGGRRGGPVQAAPHRRGSDAEKPVT